MSDDNNHNQQQLQQPEIKPQPSPEELSRAAMEKVTAKNQPEPEAEPEKKVSSPDEIAARYQEAEITIGKKEKEVRELKARMEQLQAQAQEYDEWKQSLADPQRRLAFLQSQGISSKDIVQDMVSATEEPKTKEQLEKEKLLSEIEELKQWRQQELEDRQRYANQSQLERAYQYANGFIEQNKDKYPRLAALGSYRQLVEEYQRRQNETGIEPDEHEVAKYLEDYATKKIDEQLDKLREYGILPGTPGQDQKIEQEQAQQAMSLGQQQPKPKAPDRPTLTNDMSATPSGGVDYDDIMRREGPKSLTMRQIAMRRAIEKNSSS